MNIFVGCYLFGLILVSLWFLFKLSSNNLTYIISWEIFIINSGSIELCFILDLISLSFLLTVSVITMATILFSVSYMSSEIYFVRFHMLVMGFVLSMKLLILSTNLIALLLGWDMLGVTSFLLVVYYNNCKGFNAGMLTMMSNRVGDGFLLIAVGLMGSSLMMSFHVSAFLEDSYLKVMGFLVMLAAMTKSAQIPFSAWLPAAMAAPTPVSTLVHSSTLVTAGVYLLIRLSYSLSSEGSCFILGVGLLTTIMASMTALFEMDMKKIVALSTLSQLGLMMASVGMGQYLISFFHLLVHAFFKALLFITVGNMIHSSSDFQDLRKGATSSFSLLITNVSMVSSNLSLMGIPFFSSFYSKDLIIEMNLSSETGLGVLFLFMLSLTLTVMYSLRFVFMTMLFFKKSMSVGWSGESDFYLNLSMLSLWLLSIVSGSFLSQVLFPGNFSLVLSVEMKILILGMMGLGVLFGGLFCEKSFSKKSLAYWGFGSMWAMPFFSGQGPLGYSSIVGKVGYLDFTFVQTLSFFSLVSVIRNFQHKVEVLFSMNFKFSFFLVVVSFMLVFL